MEIQYWVRQDVTWQDGDSVTADDFIWQYEFINSIQPSQLYQVWAYYHGCVKYNDYCFGVRVNVTGLWQFYTMSLGLVYPKKVWEPFWGDLTGASAFKPWQVSYTSWVPVGKQGSYPPPTCLYGTGEWIYDYYDTVLGIIRVYKNPHYWMRITAGDCKQVGCIHAPTTAHNNETLAMDQTTNNATGIDWKGQEFSVTNKWGRTFKARCTDYADTNGDGELSVCDTMSFVELTLFDGKPCYNKYEGHVHAISVLPGGKLHIELDPSWQKVTKTAVGLDIFNPDTKNTCNLTWTLYVNNMTSVNGTGLIQIATGTKSLAPLEQARWWQSIPWQTITPGEHTFILETVNTDGHNYYGVFMSVLIGDVDDNGIINMLDLYKCALKFGYTGPQCWTPEDIDNNGIVNMLDLYICAVNFGKTCLNT